MDGVSFSKVRFAALLFLAVAGVCLPPLCSHAQDKTRGEELSADETLNYLQQKLASFGVPPSHNFCKNPLQSLEISADRHLIVVRRTWGGTKNNGYVGCIGKKDEIQVRGLKTDGTPKKRPNWNDYPYPPQPDDLQTADWFESKDGVSVWFVCGHWSCVNQQSETTQEGEQEFQSHSSLSQAGLEFFNAPGEQIERISRAMAHLVDALQREPANAQQDKNDPFAK